MELEPQALRIVRRPYVRRRVIATTPAQERFVGRGRELDEVRALFDFAAAGEGSVTLVTGAEGIGKTRLLREVVSYARARGARAGFSACRDLRSGPKPLESIAAAARDAGLTASLDFDALFFAIDPAPDEPPLVLAIDDVHVIDDVTGAWLELAGQRFAGSRVMIVLAGDATDSVRTRAFESSMRALPIIELEPLEGPAMRALLRNAAGARAVPAPRIARITALAEGNPGIARELIRDLLDTPHDGLATNAFDVPSSLGESALHAFRHLPPEVREVIARAAVLGREFDSAALAELAGEAPASLFAPLRAAIDARVIDETGIARYRFRGELVRRVILGTLLAEESAALHRTAAQRLEARAQENDALAIARHWWEGGDIVRAMPHALVAASDALRHERFADALAAAGIALAGLSDRDPRHGAIELLAAQALAAEGRFDAAFTHANAARESFAREGFAEGGAEASLLLARISDVAGRYGPCATFASEALRLNGATPNALADEAKMLSALASAMTNVASQTTTPMTTSDAARVRAALVRGRNSGRGESERDAVEIAVMTALTEARRSVRDDRPHAAAKALRTAIEADRDGRFAQPIEALARELGAMLARSGSPGDASELYGAAGIEALNLQLAQATRNRQGRTRNELTKREREIALRVAAGASNREIATELVVSERTVEDHVGGIFRKLGLRNRAELAARFAERNQPGRTT